MLDEISRMFESMGVHPILGGAIAGVLLALVLRAVMSRRDPADDTARGQSRKSAVSAALTTPALGTGESGIQIKQNGTDVMLPDEVSAQIFRLVREKHKIEAIKLLRSASGLDLYDAKKFVDSLENSGSLK